MNRFLTLAFAIYIGIVAGYSQDSSLSVSAETGKIIIIQDPQVETLLNKKAEIYSKTNGKTDGYRVQIHFGSESNTAKEIKSSFIQKYPDVACYTVYQQPFFKVRAGDFKTRLEAHKFLKEVQRDFPGTFIVEDKVEMMKLE